MEINCRFYKKDIPNINELLMVKIITKEDLGYSVLLLEYGNLKGFLPMTEIIKGKSRKKNLMKIGEQFTVSVSKIYDNTIYVSKKRILDEEKQTMKIKYMYAKKINQIGKEIYYSYVNYCKINNLESPKIIDVMDKSIWRLYDELVKTYNYPEIYEYILYNPSKLVNDLFFENNFSLQFIENINDRIIEGNCRIMSEIILIVISSEGVNAIKNILNVDLNEKYKDYSLEILMISPPKYHIIVSGQNKEIGEKIMNQTLNKIEHEQYKYKCQFQIKKKNIIIKQKKVSIRFLTKGKIKYLIK